MYNIAVIGATGVVGVEILNILFERKFPVDKIYAVASNKSSGKPVSFGKEILYTEDINVFNFRDIDIAFFATSSEISRKFVPIAVKSGCIVIDKSSEYRQDKDIPLIIPEINSEDLKLYKKKNIISSPNCTITPLLMILKPLHDKFKVKRVVVSTYQSVSGSGKKAMDELYYQTKQFYEAAIMDIDEKKPEIYPKRIAFNCIPQAGAFVENGYTEEELKMVNEAHKILHDDSIKITATCVRVPVFNCHAESINIEFENKFTLDEIYDLFEEVDGVLIVDRREDGGYATQFEYAKTDDVIISRLRVDDTVKYGLNLWCVCDNLRKGATLNGVQIAELLIKTL